jgi:hypothetical protein
MNEVTTETFHKECERITRKETMSALWDHFLVHPVVMLRLWNLVHADAPERAEPKHLLWALLFLARYSADDDVFLAMIKARKEDNAMNWVGIFINLIANLAPKMVSADLLHVHK